MELKTRSPANKQVASLTLKILKKMPVTNMSLPAFLKISTSVSDSYLMKVIRRLCRH